MSQYIRTKIGTPLLRDFAAGDGTPIVIDFATGSAWYLDNNVPKPIRPFNLTTELNHAGISITSGRPFTLNAGWTRVVNYSIRAASVALGYAYDLIAGTLTPKVESDSLVGLSFDFSFTESNNDRVFYMRAFDVTAGTSGPDVIRIPVGRNTTGALIGQSILALTKTGHSYAVEFGNGDTFAGCTLVNAQFNMVDTIGIDTGGIVPITGRAFSAGFQQGFQ